MQLPPETIKHDGDAFAPDDDVCSDTVWKGTPRSLQAGELLVLQLQLA